MDIAVFDTRAYDRHAFDAANTRYGHELRFFEPRLSSRTATLASGVPVVCPFVNDRADAETIGALHRGGTRLLALRSAGFNHVDLDAAAAIGMRVVRVPEYSPYAVAELAMCLVLTLNRKVHRAYNRVREANFSLEGLVGFDLHGKTFGIIGTGRIGRVLARIAHGFGCRVLATDASPDEALQRELGVEYVEASTLYREADVISLHVPLTTETHHMIDKDAFAQMKAGVMLINTSRGALVDARALIQALKSRHVGAAGLDVYEEEGPLFFRDLSAQVLQDDVLARLLTFPNVLITSHQGFLTREALANIADTTLASVSAFARGEALVHEIGQRVP
ncbi:D-lactate dehydrogenase [Luteitalea pratensis]|uniref:D-lactate dehydrogenase n=1 Tax=Luteitalea pratensis TaxID=1855912 RepID=A0A143PJD2_LUTPR|nr:2-hydroxyacid dehydrogenase [Luteitalea pratensis]AMY07884.1 D-lactate dehydrogenase [Luteitalea pratensis]